MARHASNVTADLGLPLEMSILQSLTLWPNASRQASFVAHEFRSLLRAKPRDEVAPVTNAAGSLKRPGPCIEYWAAGINCCGQNKPFTCREAQDPNAHGGLLLSPTKQGGPAKKFFQNAMKGARDKYGLIAGNDYLLLDWVAKPIAFRPELAAGAG
ncbi:unnamed protein product [Effrenium voratum]|uniref:Uncharacterized protein n=1 Tax=Effrenium voratum TaxID=2562239 RepID=A0AA36N7F6_9DINO|nr:unnamed protein product [Effrenium voratum]